MTTNAPQRGVETNDPYSLANILGLWGAGAHLLVLLTGFIILRDRLVPSREVRRRHLCVPCSLADPELRSVFSRRPAFCLPRTCRR